MRTRRERLEDRLADARKLLRKQAVNLSARERRALGNRIERIESKIVALPCVTCNGKGLIRTGIGGYFACGDCDLGDAYSDQAAEADALKGGGGNGE